MIANNQKVQKANTVAHPNKYEYTNTIRRPRSFFGLRWLNYSIWGGWELDGWKEEFGGAWVVEVGSWGGGEGGGWGGPHLLADRHRIFKLPEMDSLAEVLVKCDREREKAAHINSLPSARIGDASRLRVPNDGAILQPAQTPRHED